MLDNFYCWLAWKLPKGLAHWAFIRVGTYATVDNRPLSHMAPGDVTMREASTYWDK